MTTARSIPSPPSREALLVELVDTHGSAVGAATVADAHTYPGRLHRAFSVFLVDPDGRVLLQQRAASKTRFPLRWANTCCGHPLPGQEVSAAAARRLDEELGVWDVAFTEIGVHTYQAVDPATGRVEHEYDHVLLGWVSAEQAVRPHPDEVADLYWADPAELRERLHGEPDIFAPWFAGVAELLLAHLAGAAPVGAAPSGAEPSGVGSVRAQPLDGVAGRPDGG